MNHEIIVDIILAVIAFVGTILCRSVKRDSNARLLLEVIEQVAPAAVIAAEKSGMNGNEKFKKAVYDVNNALKQAGITDADKTVIENAVEEQWAKLSSDGVLDQYKKEGTK